MVGSPGVQEGAGPPPEQGTRFHLWPGGGVSLGIAHSCDLHAHTAVQLSIALAGTFRVRLAPDRPWTRCSAVVIPSERQHEVDGGGEPRRHAVPRPVNRGGPRTRALREAPHPVRRGSDRRSPAAPLDCRGRAGQGESCAAPLCGWLTSSHLFHAETWLPFRQYLLWLRLAESLREISTGASLACAAERAGFSGADQLERAFRRTLGVSPPLPTPEYG